MPGTRMFFLDVSKVPADAPSWITQEYLDACTEDDELQRSWEPAIGDWYFCQDLYCLSLITDLEAYYAEGDQRLVLRSDHGKDNRGHWMCDIFIPNPSGDASTDVAVPESAAN